MVNTESQVQIDREGMFELICSFWVCRAIHAAARLGLADSVAAQPMTAVELARSVQAHPPSLYRLLRALASVGIFRSDEQGRFHPSPLSNALRTDVPGSLAPFVLMELGESHHRAWGELEYSVRTGEPSFDRVVGTPIWQFFAENPAMDALLGAAMTGMTEMTVPAVLTAYDFGRFGSIVDVGGGEGAFLSAILAAQPQASGIVFDRPDVTEAACNRIERDGAAERCRYVGGDFFSHVPSGADLYLLKWVLRDWGDERCVDILRTCRKAMRSDSTVLIVDTVIPDGDIPAPGKLIDLDMMVLSGGAGRTAAGFDNILAAAGLFCSRIIPMQSPDSLIEAVAIS